MECRSAIAVGDIAAMRTDVDNTAIARDPLMLQKIVVYALQIYGPRQQYKQTQHQQHKQHTSPPFWQLDLSCSL